MPALAMIRAALTRSQVPALNMGISRKAALPAWGERISVLFNLPAISRQPCPRGVNELIYHPHKHGETGQSPLERYQAGLAQIHPAEAETLRKAFLWREKRKVRKDGRIELQGNTYRVDPQLTGRQIELHFDPFDLSTLNVWLDGNPLGQATVLQQGRDQHIAVARLSALTPQPAKPTSSLDYLAILRTEYQTLQRQQAGTLQFSKLPQEKP